MNRLATWEHEHGAWLERASSQAFAWGAFDCMLAAADGIAAMTGVDHGADLRGRYSSEEEATALMLLFTGHWSIEIGSSDHRVIGSLETQPAPADLLGAFVASFGLTEWLRWSTPTPGCARRGDVVLVNNGDPMNAVGLVDLTGRFASCATERGLMRVPMRRWLRAWKVGI